MMMQNKEITIEDTPEAVAGRLPGFCATNADGIGITVEEEPAPRGLIYFRVYCGDKKAASARLELRTLRGDCVIGWGWRHGLTRLGKPGNREDLQRCKDFCTGFLAHIAAKDAPQITPSEPAGKALTSGPPKAPEKGAGVDIGPDYAQAMPAAVVAPVVPSSEAEARLMRRGTKVTPVRLKREKEDMKIEAMMETHSVEIIADKVGLAPDTVKTRIKKLKNSP